MSWRRHPRPWNQRSSCYVFSKVVDLKPTSWSGGIFARRDALLRVPILQMARHLHIGDAQKRFPPNEAWPRIKQVGAFITFCACPNG